MDTDSENGFLPFRRKHLTDVFSSRTGSFSPRSHHMGSEIPRNSLEFEPSNSLFVESSTCGCRRIYSRHRRIIHRLTAIVVCVIFFAVIIAPLTYHFTHSNGGVEEKNLYVNHPDTVTDKSPRQEGTGGFVSGLEERSEEEQEESAEALSPFDGAQPVRVVAQVDSREEDNGKRKRGLPPPTEEPDSDLIQMVGREIDVMSARLSAGDFLKKLRSRRELERERELIEANKNDANQIDKINKTDVEFAGLYLTENPEKGSEISTEVTELNSTANPSHKDEMSLSASLEPPLKDKVLNSVSSNTIMRKPVSRRLELHEWQELDHYMKFPEEIRSHPTEDNAVDSHEIEEALETAKVLRKRLALAKMRYKRTLPTRRYSARKFLKEDCNGLDCNDDVGAPRRIYNKYPMSVQEKLEALLEDIRDVRQKLSIYEEKLKSITQPPFEDYSLAYPTLPPFNQLPPPSQFRPQINFNTIDYPEYLPPMPSSNIPLEEPQQSPQNNLDEQDIENEIDSSDNENEIHFTQATPVAQSTAQDIQTATATEGITNSYPAEKHVTVEIFGSIHENSTTLGDQSTITTENSATDSTDIPTGITKNVENFWDENHDNRTTPSEQTTTTSEENATDSVDIAIPTSERNDLATAVPETTSFTPTSSEKSNDINLEISAASSSPSPNNEVSPASSALQEITPTSASPTDPNRNIEDKQSSTVSGPASITTESSKTTISNDVESTASVARIVDDATSSTNGMLTERSPNLATSNSERQDDIIGTPTDTPLAFNVPSTTEATLINAKKLEMEIMEAEEMLQTTEKTMNEKFTSENTNPSLLISGDGVTKSTSSGESYLTSETVLAGEPGAAESVTEISSTVYVNSNLDIAPEDTLPLNLPSPTPESSTLSSATSLPDIIEKYHTSQEFPAERITQGTSSQTTPIDDTAGQPDLDTSIEQINSNENENFVKNVNNVDSDEQLPPFNAESTNEKESDLLEDEEEQLQELSEVNKDVKNISSTETDQDAIKRKVTVREAATTKSTNLEDLTEVSMPLKIQTSGSTHDENDDSNLESSTTVSPFIEQQTEISVESVEDSKVAIHKISDMSGETTLRKNNEVSDEITTPEKFKSLEGSTTTEVTTAQTTDNPTTEIPVAEDRENLLLNQNSYETPRSVSRGVTVNSASSKGINDEIMEDKESTSEQTLGLSVFTATTPIGSKDDLDDAEEQTLKSSKIHHHLERDMFAENEDNNVTPHPDVGLHGMSLDEVRNRKQASKKFESKVVTVSSDIAVPTGPDSAIGIGETSNSGQQLSYSPYQSFAVPFQICYYANNPAKHNIEPRAPQSKTFLAPSFHLPPLVLPGTNEPASAAPSGKPGANIYNIVMTNPPQSPSLPHVPMLFAPGVMTFPPQQNIARYMGGQQALLFCSAMHSQYQSPTMPGTAEFSHSRCQNCDDESFMKKQASEKYSEDLDTDAGTLECPAGLSRCKDDQLCIPSTHWCDGRVHCGDASDEMHCSCRDRIDEAKRCDGYLDCPNAEDEAGCDDCPSTSFSCGTWDESGACIPLSKRCDGTTDCSNGRDERHCSMLSPSLQNVSNHVNYMEGFLLRNWRGEWYPVCSESGRQSWATQACEADGDPDVDQRDLPEPVKGPFLTHRSDGDFVLEHHCKGHVATHVSCPTHRCGTRAENLPAIDMASRFRRLVENHEAPVDAAERPIQAWWEKTKHKIEAEYKVKDVTAKIIPLGEEPARSARAERSVGNTGRVVGGKASSPNAWPWAVALYKDGLFHCGGTLLDNEWILTAAHCVVNFQEHYYEANIGMLRRFSFAPMQKVVPIGQIIVHDDYEPKTMKNDIAMMRLKEPVQMNRWVHPTCLPTSARNRQGMWAPAPGTKCVAVGWGAVKEHGTDPDHLREVEVPILASCKHREDIEGDEICAGLVQGGKDTCQGDSGGPLMCRDGSSAWYVAGVVSHGEGCARPDEAGAYTRVGLYIDWIVATTDSLNSAGRALSECPGFQCTSHPGRCLPQRARCNGIVDCLGGEDEKGCSERSRFENLWRSSKSSDDDLPMLQTKREQPHHDEPIFSYSTAANTSGLFKCANIIQTIPHSRICDGVQDCEDASDEVNCSCRDRIVPSKVCDGRVHCADLSDERDCFNCPDGYFNCRRSKQCIVMDKKCDDTRDCAYGEDERDCLALTKTFNLVIEADGRPKYEDEGFLAVNKRGVWSPFCVEHKENLTNKPASTICHQLGLNGFLQYDTLDIDEVNLDITDISQEFLSANIAKRSSNCTALSVTCQPYISASQEGDLGVTKMWEALVRVNGTISCTAVLLTENWLLASSSCLPENQKIARLVAEVGRQIYPPAMVEINAVKRIDGSDVLLLHVSEAVNVTHGVRSMQLPYRETLEDLTECFVMGGNRTLPVVLNQQHCSPGKVCISRSARPARNCRSAPWSGVAVCNSPDGWLPVGVFFEAGGFCGFQSSVFTDVLKYRKIIDAIIETPVTALESPSCDGFLCMGGLCIPSEMACDGLPDCPYADDEGDLACAARNATDICARDELTCANGQCTKISSWLDGKGQCEDGSDEGLQAKCAGYLQRTALDKLCDGSRHCIDKSDEDPAVCMGKGATFKCSSNMSIPLEFVCDGEEDCTGGDDEKLCVTLVRINKFAQEYEYRNVSYGLSHSICRKTPTAEEADVLCVKEGNSRHTSITMRLTTPKIVQLDHFTSVTLNNMTKLVLRSKRPFASLKPAPKKCPVAFVTCI